MDKETTTVSARVLRANDGDVLGSPDAVRDRFMIEGKESHGFSLLQHLMPARALVAPLHRHSVEDEYSFVLEGRIGALLGDEEVFAETGDLIFKPRGQWHTFWNAGDEPARILEIISPGGFEQAFREMHALGDALDPEKMAAIAASRGHSPLPTGLQRRAVELRAVHAALACGHPAWRHLLAAHRHLHRC